MTSWAGLNGSALFLYRSMSGIRVLYRPESVLLLPNHFFWNIFCAPFPSPATMASRKGGPKCSPSKTEWTA